MDTCFCKLCENEKLLRFIVSVIISNKKNDERIKFSGVYFSCSKENIETLDLMRQNDFLESLLYDIDESRIKIYLDYFLNDNDEWELSERGKEELEFFPNLKKTINEKYNNDIINNLFKKELKLKDCIYKVENEIYELNKEYIKQ